MAFVQQLDPRYSDVVLQESYFKNGSREVVNITSGSAQDIAQGTVVWRAKGTDPTAAYALISNANQIAVANEFAIVIGDGYGPKETISLANSSTNKAIVLVRDARLKEYKIKKAQLSPAGLLNDAQYASLVHLLKNQGILLETSLDAVTP